MKHLIVLPDGREISSGAQGNAIVSVSLTEAVNSGKDLTLGSCCSAMLEAKLFTPKGELQIAPGAEISLYRLEGSQRSLEGIFVLEQPTRPSANTVKLTGFDRVSKLEKDLSGWLSELTGWPYSLFQFASMVCGACGLTLVTQSIPNGDYSVEKFSLPGVTGRRLLSWCAELACRFVRATPEGSLEFAWYEDKGTVLSSEGEHHYFAKTLTYEDYATAPVDAVQLSTGEGALFPPAPAGANACVISKNPLLSGSLEGDIRPVLEGILGELRDFSYTPLKVSCPASRNIRAGDILTVTDRNGARLKTCVMTAARKGARVTLESTGKARRESSSSPTAEAIENAIQSQTQAEIFHKLTGGTEQGIYLADGKVYINASYLKAGVIEGIEIIGEKGTIGGFTLSGNTLSATYRKDFPAFTREDLTAITEVFFNWDSYTPEEQAAYLQRYDVNMDGRIGSGDAVAMSSMIHGMVPDYMEGRIVLDATNPKENIRIEVTGGYRAGEVITLGLGGVHASRVSADRFCCGETEGYTGEVAVGDKTLTVTGGIITGVS